MEQDYKCVRKCVEAYIDGTFCADIEELKNCFAPEAVMNGYLDGQMLMGTPEPFFEDMASAPSMKETACAYHAEITHLFVMGSIASAIVEETGFRGTVSMETHFQLMKINDEWKIVSKLFTTI